MQFCVQETVRRLVTPQTEDIMLHCCAPAGGGIVDPEALAVSFIYKGNYTTQLHVLYVIRYIMRFTRIPIRSVY